MYKNAKTKEVAIINTPNIYRKKRKIQSSPKFYITFLFIILYNVIGDYMFWNIIKYIIFGLVQGFTEPLPISSSGHLVLFRYLFNTDAFDDLNFEIILNFASFIAIFYIFRKDIFKLIKSFLNYIFKPETRKEKSVQSDWKYAWLIVIGSIPAAIGGFLLKDFIEAKLGNIKFLGIAFIITAILLFFVRKLNGKKHDKDLTFMDAIIIGLFQMIALTPGISRSGAVLTACLIRGLDRDTALKYTFMLYLPVSIGSFILSIKDILTLSTSMLIPYVLGFIVTIIATYFASLFFFNIVKKGHLERFSIYLIFLGIVILLFI